MGITEGRERIDVSNGGREVGGGGERYTRRRREGRREGSQRKKSFESSEVTRRNDDDWVTLKTRSGVSVWESFGISTSLSWTCRILVECLERR